MGSRPPARSKGYLSQVRPTNEHPRTGGALIRRGLRRHRRRLWIGVAGFSTHQAAEAAVPIAIGLIIDRAVLTGDVTNLTLGLAGLAGLFTVLTYAWRLGARFLFRAEQLENHLLRVEIAGRVLSPRGVRTPMKTGELLSVATSDAERTSTALRLIPLIVAASVAIVVSAVTLLRIDPGLGFGVLVAVPLILLMLHAVNPRITRRSGAQQESAGLTTALATDLVRGARTLRGIGAATPAVARYRSASRDTLRSTLRTASARAGAEGLSATATGLLLAGVATATGILAARGTIGVGEFVTVVGLTQFIAEPMETVADAGREVASAKGSAARVATVLNVPFLGTDGARVVNPSGSLELRDLSYRGLDRLSLTVEPGELVGVVAYDAAAISALVDLVAGKVAPGDYRGDVLVDGSPLDQAAVSSRRSAVLVEPHDVYLFAGTVADNLHTGDGASADLRDAALVAAAADDVVRSHPDGLERELVDLGAGLSGGQRQRLGLARALFKRPPILVLHEPTTAVDAVTEAAMATGLRRFRSGQTTVVCTTSPTLLASTDRVVVIEHGAVIGSGTHRDLVRDDDAYRKAVLR